MQEKQMEECRFVGDASLAYLKKQKDKSENIQIYGCVCVYEEGDVVGDAGEESVMIK